MLVRTLRIPRIQMMDMGISPMASPRGLWIETVLSDLGLSFYGSIVCTMHVNQCDGSPVVYRTGLFV